MNLLRTRVNAMTITCERCGDPLHKYYVCNYCDRKIGYECLKSQKKVTQTDRAYICKDCWSNTKRRKRYKSYIVLKPAAIEQPRYERR